MPFEIVRNDIVKMQVDAVVNTANPHPVVGTGVDTAIHNAAGPELLKAREEIGDIKVCEAVATPAFDLPAKYVIHVVGPAWWRRNSNASPSRSRCCPPETTGFRRACP